MNIKLGIVMDSIGSITINKDSSFAMLLEAQHRHWSLYYMEVKDLFLRDSVPGARTQQLQVQDNAEDWYFLEQPQITSLGDLDVILMRKDPPFNMEYIYTTYILQRAEEAGSLVINKPQSLRDANEKMFTAWFPQCCTPNLVSRDHHQIIEFLEEQQDIILKPLGGMGGVSIFRVRKDDPNINVIIETLTHQGEQFAMAQKYIPEIVNGDKRIILIDGEPVPYALARIPAKGETRGNLAVGGQGKGVGLTPRDYWICEQISPTLKKMGLTFVGVDVIGDYLTEINVTSPTCIRELDSLYELNIAGQLMDCIEAKLK